MKQNFVISAFATAHKSGTQNSICGVSIVIIESPFEFTRLTCNLDFCKKKFKNFCFLQK